VFSLSSVILLFVPMSYANMDSSAGLASSLHTRGSGNVLSCLVFCTAVQIPFLILTFFYERKSIQSVK